MAVTVVNGKKLDLTTFKNPGKDITSAEAKAIWDYTSGDYLDINPALREEKASAIKRHATKILNLASAVNKLRGKKCTFYRYIQNAPGLLEQMSKRGQVFVEKGFFSTTLDEYMDADEGEFSNREIKIIGTSAGCSSIRDYARYQGENEVLFPPGTEFVVTKNVSGDSQKVVRLQEIEK